MTPQSPDVAKLIERLRERAYIRCRLAIFSDPPLRPENTVEWQAADALAAQQGRVEELETQLQLICDSDNDNIVRAGYINAARDLLAAKLAQAEHNAATVQEKKP